MVETKVVTHSDHIFDSLVTDILTGALEPGRKLDEPGICRRFGVSRTPVREALRRLYGTGLVEVVPRRGVTVAQIELEKLTEMFEALAELEGLCARLSAVRMTALEKRRLEKLNSERDRRLGGGETDYDNINNEFHECIYTGCHSPSIAEVTRNFRQRVAPFRTFQFVPGHAEYALKEHNEIAQAIVAGDADRAYTLMRSHVTGVGLQVIDHFSVGDPKPDWSPGKKKAS
jgi:DNA-binding GntR family transcriptional regulator